jgi:hypothetical protein
VIGGAVRQRTPVRSAAAAVVSTTLFLLGIVAGVSSASATGFAGGSGATGASGSAGASGASTLTAERRYPSTPTIQTASRSTSAGCALDPPAVDLSFAARRHPVHGIGAEIEPAAAVVVGLSSSPRQSRAPPLAGFVPV